MSNPFARASYLLAAHTPKQLPPDGGAEVAFAGRSNAGKSSALNAMCQQNALARVSKTPGRTQQLVYFGLPPHEGRLHYERMGWAVGASWRERVRRAAAALALESSLCRTPVGPS